MMKITAKVNGDPRVAVINESIEGMTVWQTWAAEGTVSEIKVEAV